MPGSSEYGGDDGLIQPGSKGHVVGEGGADRRAGQEAAMLTRMLGMREAAGLGYDPSLGPEAGATVRTPGTVEEMRDHLASGLGPNDEYAGRPVVFDEEDDLDLELNPLTGRYKQVERAEARAALEDEA